MANRVNNRPLIDRVDTRKVSKTSLKKARHLVGEHKNDYLKSKTNHCPVQLDSRTFKILKKLKHRYGIFYYDTIKESVLLMLTVLKTNKKGLSNDNLR